MVSIHELNRLTRDACKKLPSHPKENEEVPCLLDFAKVLKWLANKYLVEDDIIAKLYSLCYPEKSKDEANFAAEEIINQMWVNGFEVFDYKKTYVAHADLMQFYRESYEESPDLVVNEIELMMRAMKKERRNQLFMRWQKADEMRNPFTVAVSKQYCMFNSLKKCALIDSLSKWTVKEIVEFVVGTEKALYTT